MTLLLICYMCGQSEKVRLSMRLLIISVAAYLLAFGGSSVYAADIGIQPGEDGLYPTTYETNATVAPSSVLVTNTNPANNSDNGIFDEIFNGSTMQESPIEIELTNLLILSEAFPYSAVYAGNNVAFYEVILMYLERKDSSTHERYIEAIIDLLYTLPTSTLEPYGLEIGGIINGLQAILMTANTYPSSSINNQTGGNGLGEYYNVSIYDNGYSRFTMNKGYGAKRISFHINGRFATACESSQCDSMLLPATYGDKVEAHITIRSKEHTKLTTQL